MEHTYFDHDNVRLHYVTDGPPEGALVIMLHGFPEDYLGWKHQIPALVAAGFRIAALDLRGAGESAIPSEVADYAVSKLARDALALMDQLGRAQAYVVGHDWGASVGWNMALRAPERVLKLVTLQVPHPTAFAAGMRSLSQLRASWYAWLFQSDGVEELMGEDRARLLAEFAFGPPGHRLIAEEDVERYRDQFSRPGRLLAGMNLYRANFHPERLLHRPRPARSVTVPTLFLYGEADRAIVPAAVETCGDYVDAEFRFVRFPGASHWLQHERAAEVNTLLLEFLTVS